MSLPRSGRLIHRASLRHRPLFAALLLLLLVGCSGVAPLGREIGSPQVGVILGRVELGGSAGQPAAAPGSVVVYLEPSDASPSALAVRPTDEIRIGGGRQEPLLVLVPPNQPFRFLNLDPIHHEPFSLDAPNDFRVRIGGRAPSAPIRLPQSGFVRAFCGLHPTETFALIVSPANHVVAVERDGSFTIANVRSGDYRVRAAGLDSESPVVPVRVGPGETLKVQLNLSPRGAR